MDDSITCNYKRTVNPTYWEEYVGRNLTKKERILLGHAKSEQHMNNTLHSIHNIIKERNLHIPALTNLHGNCIFESFSILGLCGDINQFRSGIAQLFLILKNSKNFLPGCDESLGELFLMFNEVECVECTNSKKLYKYNYDMMCVDLAKDTNWTRLNTEMIFRIMCVLLNINIIIHHSNGHVTNNLNVAINKDTINIHLGQLGELHYIPIKQNIDTEEYKCPIYTEYLKDFHTWARSMAMKTGNIEVS